MKIALRRAIATLGTLLALASAPPLHAQAVGGTEAPDKAEFGAKVREYLLSNPDLVREVLQLLVQREQSARERERDSALAAHGDFLFRDVGAPSAGSANADAVIVEFMDYRCPHCRRAAGTVEALVRDDPKVRVVYRDFPVLGPESVFSARAALAAHRQGRYMDMHRALFEQPVGDEAAAMGLAKKLRLDVKRFAADMNDPEVLGALVRNQEVAAKLGINGTPAFIVGRRIVPGATDIDTLKGLVQQAREQK